MQSKKLGILAVVAIVLGGIYFLMSPGNDKRGDASGRIGEKVFQELPLNDIAEVVIRDKTATATLVRTEDNWVCREKFDYPADFDKLRKLLLSLSELKVGQVPKMSEKKRQELKLVSPDSDSESSGTFVEMKGEDGKVIASLLVGEQHRRQAPAGTPGGGYPDGRFISTDGGKTVYLVTETLTDINAAAKEMLKTDLLDVVSGDITRIKISGPGRDLIELVRAGGDNGEMNIQGLAEDEEMETSKRYSLESALSYLKLSDVADPALGDEATGMDAPIIFQAETLNGETYTVKVGKPAPGGSGRYVRVGVELAPAPPEKDEAPVEGEDEAAAAKRAQAKEMARQRREKLEADVAKLKARLGDWTFVVESYKTDNLTMKRDQIVKKKEKPAEEETAVEGPVEAPAG